MALVRALQSAHHHAAIGFHITARPLDCLYARFFVQAQNDCVQRRVQIESHDVGSLCGELLISAHAPTAEPLQVDALPTQYPPYRMNTGIEFLSQCRPVPSGHATWRWLFNLRQQAVAKIDAICDRLAGSWLVQQTLQSSSRKSLSPLSDRWHRNSKL